MTNQLTLPRRSVTAIGPGDRSDDEQPNTEPGWCIVLDTDGDGTLTPIHESLLALSNGTVGVRGDVEASGTGDHFLLVAGAFGTGTDGLTRPLPGPAWTVVMENGIVRDDIGPGRWVLDLRTGIEYREPQHGGVGTIRFASLARPGVVVLRAHDSNLDRDWPEPLGPPAVNSGPAAQHDFVVGRNRYWWAETHGDRGSISTVAEQTSWRSATQRHLLRIVAVGSGARASYGESEHLAQSLDSACAAGFERLVEEQRAEWGSRWGAADIEIDGDPDAQVAIRFALFHLLSSAPTEGEAAVGARGLTGLAYGGHVFWDTEAFVLPALAATCPEAARALIRYRTNRLPVARNNAAELGLPGARFPWESARRGVDVTPRSVRDLDGHFVPILTGEHAEHINADIAWAVHRYLAWTSDSEVLDDGGRDLVLDTARYWMGRIRCNHGGRGHILGVVGPDEYHGVVDDNAFTNGMVRWHLEWAATLSDESGSGAGDEADAFRETARSLVDGFDAGRGCHEQFAGYWDLEPLMIGDIAQPPVAADVLLGPDRVKRSQVIKQPDVLMLHLLLGQTEPDATLRADLDCYLPRTAHGSSLSPAVCAALLARAGRPDEALRLFDIAAQLDLDDLTGTTSGGLHLANMGGLWQAVVFGFAGIRPTSAGLSIDPHLPTRWDRLVVRVRYRGTPVQVAIDPDGVRVTAERAVPILIHGQHLRTPIHYRLPEKEGTQS